MYGISGNVDLDNAIDTAFHIVKMVKWLENKCCCSLKSETDLEELIVSLYAEKRKREGEKQ